MKSKKVALFVLILVGLTSCSKEEAPKPEPEKEYFTKILSFTADEINDYLATNGLSSVPKAKIGVTLYKHIYQVNSPYDNTPVDVSGLVIIPDEVTASDIISLQHGTIFENNQAPTRISRNNLLLPSLVSTYLSSASQTILVASDYIGYTSSLSTFHPYIHRSSTAESVIQLILSVQEHIPKQFSKITVNKGVTLLGYSEGGYATIASTYHIATNNDYNDKITIKRSIPMAAVYNPQIFTKEIAASTILTPTHNKLYTFALLAYNRLYRIYADIKTRFVNAIASKTTSIYENIDNMESITFSDNLQKTFSETQLADLKNPNSALGKKLGENAIPISWTPKIKIHVLHSREDATVPITQARWFAQHSGKSTSVIFDTTNLGSHTNAYLPLYLKATTLVLFSD